MGMGTQAALYLGGPCVIHHGYGYAGFHTEGGNPTPLENFPPLYYRPKNFSLQFNSSVFLFKNSSKGKRLIPKVLARYVSHEFPPPFQKILHETVRHMMGMGTQKMYGYG